MAKITPKMILEDALAILEDEDSWCKKHLAMDEDGVPCAPTDPQAEYFCIHGAITRVANKLGADYDTKHHARELLRGNMPVGYHRELTAFNDENDHAAVVELFETTIKRLK